MNPKSHFFLSLSSCINEIPILSLHSAKVPILLAVPSMRDAGFDCFANERVSGPLAIAAERLGPPH